MNRNVFGFPKTMHQDGRKNFRVADRIAVKWAAGMNIFSGFGRIKDISSTGALIHARSVRPIEDGTVLNLEPQAALDQNFLPAQARVVWSKKKGFFNRDFLCGLEFISPADEILSGLRKHIQERVAVINKQEYFKEALKIALLIIFAVLGLFALRYQAIIMRTIERSNHLMMSSSSTQAGLLRYASEQYTIQQGILNELTLQYQATSVLLSQTEALLAQTQQSLAQARDENQNARAEIAALSTALSAAQTASLDDQAQALIQERDSLRQELALLRAEIDSALAQDPQAWAQQSSVYQSRMDDAQLKVHDLKYSTLMERIREHRKDIQLSKTRIRDLQRQAADVRRERQAQKDQIALSRGNRGYMVRDGRHTSVPETSGSKPSSPRISIDVSFVE